MSIGKQIDWYDLTLEITADRISEENNIKLTKEDVGRAISEMEGFSQNLQIFWYTLEHGLSIYHKLKNYPFNQTIGQIELIGDDCVFPDNIPANIYEAEIKIKGQIWIIHKNDVDPFPSDPHAHNYETGLKLDLSNGFLYRKKEFVESINKKKLVAIREKCSDKNIVLPTLTV
jgi:hypothetical protein